MLVGVNRGNNKGKARKQNKAKKYFDHDTVLV